MPINPRFLLDTNICIYLLEGRGGEIVRRRIEAAVRGTLVTSTIVQAEVMIGADRRDMLSVADALFTIIPPVPFDQSAARTYASLPFRRGNLDRLIAAHAIS
ncbi:PIN domain-containing protein, partial [Sphingomonas sp. 66-10]